MKFHYLNEKTYEVGKEFEINKGDRVTIQWNISGYGVRIAVNGSGGLCSYGTALDVEKFTASLLKVKF